MKIEIPKGLFTGEFDDLQSLYSVNYYKQIANELGLDDYIQDIHLYTSLDDNYILMPIEFNDGEAIMVNDILFHQHNRVVSYLNMLVKVKSFKKYLTDEIGLEWDKHFRFSRDDGNNAVADNSLYFQTKPFWDYDNHLNVYEETTEDEFKEFIEKKFENNEYFINYTRKIKLEWLLNDDGPFTL